MLPGLRDGRQLSLTPINRRPQQGEGCRYPFWARAGVAKSDTILTVRNNAKRTTPPNLPKVARRPLLDQVAEGFLLVYNTKNPSGHLARGIRQSALENRHEQR